MKVVTSAISLVVLVGFGAIGLSSVAGAESLLLGGFGVFVVAYAVGGVVVLVKAWRSPSAKWSRLAAILGVAFSALWIVGSFDYGSMSGLEVAGAILYSLAASLNWLAIHVVIREPPSRRLHPTAAGSSPDA